MWPTFPLLVTVVLVSNCASGTSSSLINRGESWPRMPNYDIWGSPHSTPKQWDHRQEEQQLNYQNLSSASLLTARSSSPAGHARRNGKVLNFFPVHSDDECLSDDGRRVGACLNVYECRLQGGTARGECALGFGVCCIFVATCDQEIINNITYIVSPNFPAVMSRDVKNCKLKIRPVNEHISQLRFDFIHFQMGQPNRRTGVCEGDYFSLRGGSAGIASPTPVGDLSGEANKLKEFTICGQNSGQHLYYDIEPPKAALKRNNGAAAALPQIVDIVMNFNQRFFLPRMWEIRVTQIPFSQRAPLGCLQYFTGEEGLIQTFNFAENGRHLANQNYRACIRQETGMCSIAYEPCDDQSFRIGANNPFFDGSQGFYGPWGYPGGYPGAYPGAFPGAYPGGFPGAGVPGGSPAGVFGDTSGIPGGGAGAAGSGGAAPGGGISPAAGDAGVGDGGTGPLADTPVEGAADGDGGGDLLADADGDGPDGGDADLADETPADDVQADEPVDEGSGGGAIPSRGGFFSRFSMFFSRTIPDFSFDYDEEEEQEQARSFRSGKTFGWAKENLFTEKSIPIAINVEDSRNNRNNRQLYRYCNDRITLPCIIEDFIGTGSTMLSTCQPVHCGNSLCPFGQKAPCRLETSVTPFALGFHFGEGLNKGSPEENIGACLRYNQLKCL